MVPSREGKRAVLGYLTNSLLLLAFILYFILYFFKSMPSETSFDGSGQQCRPMGHPAIGRI
jgi:hypothetical protein